MSFFFSEDPPPQKNIPQCEQNDPGMQIDDNSDEEMNENEDYSSETSQDTDFDDNEIDEPQESSIDHSSENESEDEKNESFNDEKQKTAQNSYLPDFDKNLDENWSRNDPEILNLMPEFSVIDMIGNEKPKLDIFKRFCDKTVNFFCKFKIVQFLIFIVYVYHKFFINLIQMEAVFIVIRGFFNTELMHFRYILQRYFQNNCQGYFLCENCRLLHKCSEQHKSFKCSKCQSVLKTFFYYYSIRNCIERRMKNDEFVENIKYYKKRMQIEDVLSDIFDGFLFRKLKSFFLEMRVKRILIYVVF